MPERQAKSHFLIGTGSQTNRDMPGRFVRVPRLNSYPHWVRSSRGQGRGLSNSKSSHLISSWNSQSKEVVRKSPHNDRS